MRFSYDQQIQDDDEDKDEYEGVVQKKKPKQEEKHRNSENRSVYGVVLRGRGMRYHPKKDLSFKCERCKKTFGLNNSLQRHNKINACVEKVSLKMPSEQQCNVMLARLSVVKRHMELVHIKRTSVSPSGKSHRCMHCEFYTLLEKNLTKHIELMHPSIDNPGSKCEDGVNQPKKFNKSGQPGAEFWK